MNVAVLDERIPTVADVIADLGDVPINRVLMKPFPGTATEADVLRLGALDRLFELVEGTLVEKPMGSPESLLATWLAHRLYEFVERHQLGILLGADGLLRMSGGNVRMPDLSFIAWDQFPDRRVPTEPIFNLSPVVVIEVLSSSNTRQEMRQKREDYFGSGTQLVWEIDPEERTVRVFVSVEDSTLLTTADRLDGGAALPGFGVLVSDIFDRLDQRRPTAQP